MKKCKNKLTNSSAVLAVVQQLLPGEGTLGCASSHAKPRRGEGVACRGRNALHTFGHV